MRLAAGYYGPIRLSSAPVRRPQRHLHPTRSPLKRPSTVKAISAAWGQRGVTLSQPQFTSAQQLKDRYWLYVVENPGTPSQLIPRIQNPAVLVQCFAYDQGWRALAEPGVSPAPQG